MSWMNEIYSDFSLERPLYKSFAEDARDRHLAISAESASGEIVRGEYRVQENIRALFGKEGHNPAAIGGHPDFDHLENVGLQKRGHVVSLFVDIKGSTKLGVMYTPEEVFWIKNQIIKFAIETVLAFDGHVHRIMGDAVLAFFRGEDVPHRNSAINALNCGAYLVEFMRSVVSPQMRKAGVEDDVGIRVGIDYGNDDLVIWGMYGYSGSLEVTATSYHVDVAAKLQQRAGKNKVMIGQALVELLDLHDEVAGLKSSAGEIERYVTPNYTDKNGKPKNYRQYVVNHDKYFGMLPKPSDRLLPIKVTGKVLETGLPLFKCAECVPVERYIEFSAEFQIAGWTQEEVRVRFRVENHGAQASSEDDFANHSTEKVAEKGVDGIYRASNVEPTAFLGLHYMYVSVVDSNGRVFHKEQIFPVYIG